jgi:predicted metal-dependent HD superfamily phosphohydrolase
MRGAEREGRVHIDHLFLFIEPDGPEIDTLRRIGLAETYRRAHPGQGTANACFAFDNLFLELLWLTSEADARSPAIARTRLWERSRWSRKGACPLGIAIRGDLAEVGVPTWDYRPPYLSQVLPAGAGIPVATASDDPAVPMVFTSPGNAPPAQWPPERRGKLQQAAGFGPVRWVELSLPAHAASAPPLRALASADPPLRIAPRADGQHSLRLALADPGGRHTHTLDLATTGLGQWRITLIDEDLPRRSWQRAWASLGLGAPEGLMQQLMVAWAEPQRHYHTPQHLRECLALLDPALGLAQHPGKVELALWFHDAIYDPQGKDNEARSADWAVEALAQAGANREVQQRVRALIMATCHDAEPEGDDAQLLVDIDLAILGADPARFAEYDAQVREEYRWVPEAVYRVKRREVLAGFLARPMIYATERFRDRFEGRARENLERATR